MKNFAFVVALVLLAFAVPVSAEEISSATPLMTTLERQIEGPVQPVDRGPQPILYCSVVQGTSCTTVGATRSCTDVCHNQLSCTCTYYYSNPNVKFWNCMYEC